MAKAARKPAPGRAKSASRKKAAGKTAAGRSRTRPPRPPADAAAALRLALLDLAATQGWRDLSLAEIAERAGLDPASAHAVYPTKAAILLGLVQAIDSAVLQSLRAEPLEGEARDRLFDLLMRRFDRLQQHRAGYARLLRELPQTPLEMTALGCQMRRSLRLMLETAGISASGLKGALRLQGLLAIHLAGLRAWVRDDSADLAKTMAEIDKRLGQAARLNDMLLAGIRRAEAMKAEGMKAARA